MDTTSQTDAADAVRPRIVVVDDQADARELVRMMLAKECDVLEADSGEAGWELALHDERVQMMITDLRMPGLDGCDLIGRVRASDDARIRDMPILLITGADDNEARQRAFLRGATGFIVKPIDIHQLRALVSMYLRNDAAPSPAKPKAVAPAAKSSVDALTNLRSASYFVERGIQDFTFSVYQKSDLAVICLEIEGFKDLLSAHGQHTTDQLLRWFSELLLSRTRTEDTVAGLGGAQFAILSMATDPRGAEVLCDAIRAAVNDRPFMHAKNTIPVALRLGVATLKRDRAKTLQALLTQARERLLSVDEAAQSVPSQTATDATSVEFATPNGPAAPAPQNQTDLESTQSSTVEWESSALAVDVPESTSESPTAEEMPSMLAEIGEPMEMAPVELDTPPAPSAAAPVPMELMSVDTAIMLVAQHHENLLRPYAQYLLQQIQPLLDFHQKHAAPKAGTR
jgi:two-component system cell cycle response regulator